MPIFISDPMPVSNHGERHIPAILLVDKSGSMQGAPINELNQGLIEFGQALEADSLAQGRADICIIGFDSNVQVEVGFRPATEYTAPTLSAGGCTALNEAIEVALDTLEERKKLYHAQGVEWYRPWLFVLTDGEATDTERESAAISRLRTAIENKKVVYMPLAVGPHANKRKLQEYYPTNAPSKHVLSASASNFKEAFVWVSNSLGVVAHSNPQVQNDVTLPPTPPSIQVGI